ncbi:MAG: serine/threonine-protein kinase PknK, partial [Gemmatimonadetes bacterium]|nr:serine/threonine-protein kinase PknK [Gemmatimonadota bacterium]
MSTDQMVVPGYVPLHVLRVGGAQMLCRARSEDSGSTVLLKVPAESISESGARAALQREAVLFRRLSVDGVPGFVGLDLGGSRPALILEDRPGDPLSAVIEAGALAIPARIRFAWHLAKVLEEVHAAHILHLSLNPSSVLIDAATLGASIVDFGSAVLRGAARPPTPDPDPAYLAPEQSGRTAWEVDERSDLYSLGAILYELFTGRRPFVSDDPLEVVHAHIARRATAPVEVDPKVPTVIGDVISKLLSKSPEDRYQSASGLAADLERALHHAEAGEDIPAFELGRRDLGHRLVLPPGLYGRKQELTLLQQALERSRSGPGEVVLVEGYSGIGKTALVGALAGRAVEDGGRFVSGKFDQLVRGAPYTAIRQAFRELMRQVLVGSDTQIRAWSGAVSEALGQAGQVIVDFLPELGRILGPQPAVAELGPAEAQNRFSRLFREFVRATTGPERPLVLFLDDLQWIDSASRDLMRVVLSNWPSSGLLVVGAFRNNEVGPDHPLMELIQDLSSSGTSVSSIRLEPLGQESLDTFVADSLRGDAEHGAPLASLIARKTGGNPFFVTQFMRSLAERDLLVPDRSSGVWAYDLDGIEKQPSTPNVVDLLAGRIERLPDAACEALKMAACLGNRFDERTLTIVSGGDRQQVRESLRVALAEGFLLRGDEVGDANAGTLEGEGPSTYRFLHDRVQQAAYVLIPRSERAKVHVG